MALKQTLLKVTNDLLLTLDAGNNAVLILLDLRAAFNAVDHSCLLACHGKWVGIRGRDLKWFDSYLFLPTGTSNIKTSYQHQSIGQNN